MSQKIKHAGVVDSVEGRHVRVRIVQQAACASCKIASRCNTSEAKEKIIDVFASNRSVEVGQRVTVSTSEDTAKRALTIGFILPLTVLMGVLLTAKLLGRSDETAALLAMGMLIPYYIIIWLCKEKIARQISFELEED